MKFDRLNGRVVVITGASSGIGKLAAEKFIDEGAFVVLAARSEEDMKTHLAELGVGEECAIAVKTDVSDFAQVQELVEKTLDHFGVIDIWVNNAAVNLYGFIEETDIRDIEQVIKTDLMGPIYGMKAVWPVMLRQKCGTIINVGSVDAVLTTPLQSAYNAAKHGMLGFSGSLREDLLDDHYNGVCIDIVDILPSSMDTPLFEHAKTTTGKQPEPIPPVYDPSLVVDAIIKNAKKPKPFVVVGAAGKIMTMQTRLMPALSEWIMGQFSIHGGAIQTSESKSPEEDNLYEPMPGTNRVHGKFPTPQRDLATYVKQHPVQTAAMALVPLALIFFRRRAA